LPPYVYKDQFSEAIVGIKLFSAPTNDGTINSPIAFLTCTNTLGNSLLFSDQAITSGDQNFAVPTALGGLAGDSLHPLALGNVFTFKNLISSQEAKEAGIGHIKIIGVGGVTSPEAAMRMRNVGAAAVGCATLFGKEGVHAFEIIGKE
jgi:dihydroorotate dehydrogenase (fumarate)